MLPKLKQLWICLLYFVFWYCAGQCNGVFLRQQKLIKLSSKVAKTRVSVCSALFLCTTIYSSSMRSGAVSSEREGPEYLNDAVTRLCNSTKWFVIWAIFLKFSAIWYVMHFSMIFCKLSLIKEAPLVFFLPNVKTDVKTTQENLHLECLGGGMCMPDNSVYQHEKFANLLWSSKCTF